MTRAVTLTTLVLATLAHAGPCQDGTDSRATLRALRREWFRREQAWEHEIAAHRRAGDDERARELEAEPPTTDLESGLLEFAATHAATELARDALRLLAERSESARAATAVERLAREWATDPALARLSIRVPRVLQHLGEARAVALLERLAAEQPDASARARAHYYAGEVMYLARPDAPVPDAARTHFEAAATLAPDDHITAFAARALHAVTALEIGAEAPAIEGSDLGGAPWRLAEFRGEVVLLSFWADW